MGWIKKSRDTGWLDVTTAMPAGAGRTSGRMLVRRRGDVITVIFDELVVDLTGTKTLLILPTGLRPFHTERAAWWQPDTSVPTAGGTLNLNSSGYVVGYLLAAGLPMTARMTFDCVQAWPSTYPGSEVQL